MRIREFVTSIYNAGRENRIFRILMLFCLAVILLTLITLFQLAKLNANFGAWQIGWFSLSCVACLYILVMTYYVKAQRDRTKRVSEERYRSIIAISNMGAWEFHTETGYLWCSPEYFQMLGYEEHTFLEHYAITIETVWLNMLHPEDRQMAVEKFALFSSGKGSDLYENTFRLRHRGGNWIWILARSKALSNGGGTQSKVILGSHIDISEKISIQMELQNRNQKLMNFAFSNAHHVRGPVARMLGLVELVKIDTKADHEWYLQTISNEVQELDKITKSIARDLDEIR